ncbi:organic cation transporter protein-like isoform X1 [Schistocerca piceifrons]|uniref:organic cation transporter protein-like isoform X1 n=2 Tax=Schistocerca piceifrons TaxID=274613 RepID=UPI001F5E706F|nr:organic cation transporter protein-like isoform X1 [Schistocerca piceifrons]XP_047108545.1 organic cation transporter protein-like isoform X1 [Schistocerca piceifrons]
MYTLLTKEQREVEENNNDSKDKDTNDENVDGYDCNNSNEYRHKGSNNEDDDNQDPLLDVRMGREHKKRQPWHMFLLLALVKIPSAWQMASILVIGPDKRPGTYWCSSGQLSPEDILKDPCSTYLISDMLPISTVNFTENVEVSPCGYTEFPVDHYHTFSQDRMNSSHGGVHNLTNMGQTPPAYFSKNEDTVFYDKPGIPSDNYNITDQGTRRQPCKSSIDSNATLMSSFEARDSKLIAACEHFEFSDGFYSIIDQWQLVCKRKMLVPTSQLFYLLGVLFGGILFKYLSQVWSPRLILIGGMIVQIISGVGVAVSPYFTLHCALRFVTALACTQMFTAGYNICTSLMEGKARTVAGCCYEHLWSVGVITLACIAGLCRDWRHLQLAISLPTVLILLLFRYIPESPEWKPKKKLRKKKQIPFEDDGLKTDKTTNEIHANLGGRVGKIKAQHQSLHKESTQKVKYIGLHAAWAFTVVTYYGGLLNTKNLGPELFLNIATAGVAEVAGALTALIILLRKSRIWLSLGIINIAGGLCCFSTWALPEDLQQWYPYLLFLAMMGRIAIACSLTILTVASGNQFTPACKAQGVFTCVTVSRIFLQQAPFVGTLAVYGERVSLSVFGLYTFLAGISALTQTMKTEEIEKVGRGKNSYELGNSTHQMKDDGYHDV